MINRGGQNHTWQVPGQLMKKQTEQTHYVMREGAILNIDTRKLLLGQIVAVVFLQLFATPVWSQEDESQDQPSAADIANELANPNTALGFLAFQLDHIKYDGELPGADQQDAWKLNFQPNIPYPLGDGKNFFLRPLIPIVLDQPVFVGGSFEDRGVELVANALRICNYQKVVSRNIRRKQ